MVILIHSSKTMRPTGHGQHSPALIKKAARLDKYLKTLSASQIQQSMHIAPTLAAKTQKAIASWSADGVQYSAGDTFVGDIYSGLRFGNLSAADREYADGVLRILSGLYGVLRPFDGIQPYRLEMGYRLPGPDVTSLYNFWGEDIARTLAPDGVVVNVSSAEYTKAVLPYVEPARIITPKFLTVDPDSGEPKFVVVHAKIARGAFARWLVMSRTTDPLQFGDFKDLGYRYDPEASTIDEPVFICQEFQGLGLSVRGAPSKQVRPVTDGQNVN